MLAVIVAAGRGRRLMPLTADTPKPLLTVDGTPIIEYLLRGLKWAGVTDVIVVVRYLGDRIRAAYGDGSACGMNISYVEQHEIAGTGAAVLSVEDVVGDEPFLLLWGDVLMAPENYLRIQELHAAHSSPLRSALNWMDDPSAGASVVTEDDRIVAIYEKPPLGSAPSNWNQAGLFVCGREIFGGMRACGLSPRGEVEFTAGVEELLSKREDVRCMFIPQGGFWSDVGTPEALAALNADPSVRQLLK